MKSFLYEKSKLLSPKLCNKWIETYNKSNLGRKITAYKRSTDISFAVEDHIKYSTIWSPLLKPVLSILNDHLKIYINKYFNIDSGDYEIDENGEYRYLLASLYGENPLKITPFLNIQHYKPEEGYTNWHCERHFEGGDRVLAWAIYLNDVDDGGTEFFYEDYVVEAERGKLCIFSADWVHAHRGIPSNTQHKYILTGWFSWSKEKNCSSYPLVLNSPKTKNKK